MVRIAIPAMQAVATELEKSGADVSLDTEKVEGLDVEEVELHVRFNEAESFSYQIYPIPHETPSFAYRVSPKNDRYFRLEVFTANGSRGYDVYGYTEEQLISDVLGHYESHMEYLRLASSDTTHIDEDALEMDWRDDFTSNE